MGGARFGLPDVVCIHVISFDESSGMYQVSLDLRVRGFPGPVLNLADRAGKLVVLTTPAEYSEGWSGFVFGGVLKTAADICILMWTVHNATFYMVVERGLGD